MIALAKIVGLEVAPVTLVGINEPRELAAFKQVAREGVEPDRDASVVESLQAMAHRAARNTT